MIVEASPTGVFRTILVIIGAIVLLRFIGQLMIAKRNLEEENRLKKADHNFEKERKRKLKTFGQTQIIIDKSSSTKPGANSKIEDITYEEV